MLHIEPAPLPPQSGDGGGQCGALDREAGDASDAHPAAGSEGPEGIDTGVGDGMCARDPNGNSTAVGDQRAEAADVAADVAESDEADAPGGQEAAAAAARHHERSQQAMAAARRKAAATADADAAAATTAAAADAATASAAGQASAAADACADSEAAAAAAAAGGSQAAQQHRQQQQQRPMRLEMLIPPNAHAWVGHRIIGGGAGAAFMQLAQQVGLCILNIGYHPKAHCRHILSAAFGGCPHPVSTVAIARHMQRSRWHVKASAYLLTLMKDSAANYSNSLSNIHSCCHAACSL